MAARPYLVPALHASELVADHEWAAVTRVATDCILGANGSGLTYDDGERFTEGRNRGWPGDAGRAAYAFHPSAASHKSRWGYGCWFYLMRGAPAAINVGRSLRAQTRREVHATLGIPCPASDPLCTTPPGDKLYCELASKLGYATIQIAQAHFNARPELIACHGKCMSAAVRGACPPLPLQRADRPGERCKCDRRSAHLGCGSTEPLSCAAARPARAQMWHDACVAGLYRNCTDGSRPRAAPAPAATLAGSRRRARRRRDAGRRLASASPPVVEPAADAASAAAAAQVAASVAAAAVATHVPPKPRKKLLKRSKSMKHKQLPPPPPPPPPPTRVEWTRGLLKDVLFGILFGVLLGVLVGISRAGFRAGLLE